MPVPNQPDLTPTAERERLWAILDSLFSFVALLDLDGVVLDCNRAALEAARGAPRLGSRRSAAKSEISDSAIALADVR